MCTQVHTHTHTHTHTHEHTHTQPSRGFPCPPLDPFKTSRRNKSPATPDPEMRLRRKVSTAWPGEAGSVRGQALQEQAEGRPEHSSSQTSPWPGVLTGRWVGLTPRKPDFTAQKAGPSVYWRKGGRGRGQEARELGDIGRSTLLPGRGRRPRQRKGGVPPQAASPSGAVRRAEQRLMGRRAWCILRTRGGQLPRRCSSQPAVGAVALLAGRGASLARPGGPPSTSPGCRNPLRRWC